jgi:hypothetical protein
MSNYIQETKHPETGKWEKAEWLDDHFGKHLYGVRFPSDGRVFDPRGHDVETRETTDDEKIIEHKQHKDGRKDVKIHVKRLDVNPKDEAGKKAKKHIEDVVFPALAERMVLVVVIHKPTNDHAERIVKAANVRSYAEAVVKAHVSPSDEFVIVEHELKAGTVRVSTL